MILVLKRFKNNLAKLMLFIYVSILPFMALVGGKIKVSEITNHCRTNIYAIEQFFGNIFNVDDKEKIIFV